MTFENTVAIILNLQGRRSTADIDYPQTYSKAKMKLNNQLKNDGEFL